MGEPWFGSPLPLQLRNRGVGRIELPQPLAHVDFRNMDLVVNMSGYKIPGVYTVDWSVADPMGRDIATFRSVRDDIEMRVMQMILKMRMGKM